MSTTSAFALPGDSSWLDVLRRLGESARVRVILACGLVCGLLGAGWAFWFPGKWTASQSLVVRDDLLGESFKPGRFNTPESLKSAQETILHMARKPEVLRAALAGAGYRPDSLTPQAIEQWQRQVSVIAPNGAEFGKTEVVVLRVRERSAGGAAALAASLTEHIETQLRDYRTRLLASMKQELESGLTVAAAQYAELAERVGAIERSVGADVTTLRAMVEPNAGGSDLRQSLETVRAEIRNSTTDLERAQKQLDLIRSAAGSPHESLATSHELLEMQPVLKRLLDGLADARLALSSALGKYGEGHPTINNAREAVDRTVLEIRHQLDAAATGLESQIAMFQQKLDRLRSSESWYSSRLAELGQIRVEYKSLVEELTKRNEVLSRSRADLARVQSLGESTDRVSLITLIGEPQVGSRPDGLSRKAMVFIGLIGGMGLGLGWTVLRSGPPPGLHSFTQWLLAAPEATGARAADPAGTAEGQQNGVGTASSVTRKTGKNAAVGSAAQSLPTARPFGASRVLHDDAELLASQRRGRPIEIIRELEEAESPAPRLPGQQPEGNEAAGAEALKEEGAGSSVVANMTAAQETTDSPGKELSAGPVVPTPADAALPEREPGRPESGAVADQTEAEKPEAGNPASREVAATTPSSAAAVPHGIPLAAPADALHAVAATNATAVASFAGTGADAVSGIRATDQESVPAAAESFMAAPAGSSLPSPAPVASSEEFRPPARTPVRDVLAEAESRVASARTAARAPSLPAGVRPGMMVESDSGRRPGFVPIGRRPATAETVPVPPPNGDQPPEASAGPAAQEPATGDTAPYARNQTVSLDQVRIEEIRRQILELDPSIQFDVFCEPLKKPPQQS